VTFIHATGPKEAAATSLSESVMFRPQSKKVAQKNAHVTKSADFSRLCVISLTVHNKRQQRRVIK